VGWCRKGWFWWRKMIKESWCL